MAFIKMTEQMIDECFDGKDHQSDVMVAIYRIAFPKWDDIKAISGWPRVNKKTWAYVARKFFKFDPLHHDSVMPGGCWMNQGFGSDDTLPDWKISLNSVSVEYTTPVEAAIS